MSCFLLGGVLFWSTHFVQNIIIFSDKSLLQKKSVALHFMPVLIIFPFAHSASSIFNTGPAQSTSEYKTTLIGPTQTVETTKKPCDVQSTKL